MTVINDACCAGNHEGMHTESAVFRDLWPKDPLVNGCLVSVHVDTMKATGWPLYARCDCSGYQGPEQVAWSPYLMGARSSTGARHPRELWKSIDGQTT